MLWNHAPIACLQPSCIILLASLYGGAFPCAHADNSNVVVLPEKYSVQWKAGKRSMKYTVFSVTSTQGSMYRMAHISFQGQVMGPSFRPNFQSFFSSSSSSPAPLDAFTTCCRKGNERQKGTSGSGEELKTGSADLHVRWLLQMRQIDNDDWICVALADTFPACSNTDYPLGGKFCLPSATDACLMSAAPSRGNAAQPSSAG
eukprot:1159015-Pelagomonas_calceolata.AAC.7